MFVDVRRKQIFADKKALSNFDGLPGERSWGRHGRELAPKTPQNDPRIKLYRFLMDLASLWNGFLKI